MTGANGLSFAPNIYHHEDDYPLRNSVLVTATSAWGRLPYIRDQTAFVMAHEISHMLLNTGLHENDPQNQCDSMRYIREWLYGEAAVSDPGPPGA